MCEVESKYYILEIYHYGKEWEEVVSKTLHNSFKEAREVFIAHKKKFEEVNGVNNIERTICGYTQEQLKNHLTYSEYLMKFGEYSQRKGNEENLMVVETYKCLECYHEWSLPYATFDTPICPECEEYLDIIETTDM